MSDIEKTTKKQSITKKYRKRGDCSKGTRRNRLTIECDEDDILEEKQTVIGVDTDTGVDTVGEQLEVKEVDLGDVGIDIDTMTESVLEPVVNPDVLSEATPSLCTVDLQKDYSKLDCRDENRLSTECNKFLLKQELTEKNCLAENPTDNAYLYPSLNDPNFNIKIDSKKEFNDTKYDGTIHENIKEHADMLAEADFELQPHQAFVKNFLSTQTPYNSLMLYHGLGTGKTCSAIGVCEEMRDFMKQNGVIKKIIIVASENVQDNFRMQLFDERKLKLVDGLWSITGCIGNKIINEVNPMNMKGIPKDKLISHIKSLINTHYLFLGYVQFANYIYKTMNHDEDLNDAQRTKRARRRLKTEFENRLIVIDEVHNIRKTDDNENKKVAENLEVLVKAVGHIRFIFLSATPMYNNYKEIVWLLNLMNINDKRGRIKISDVFDINGEFKENGKELLMRKATGYISFIRGENPYTFPYRVYPNEFAAGKTFPAVRYPPYQMNLMKIKNKPTGNILKLYLNTIGNCGKCGNCQYCVYKYIINTLRAKRFKKEMPNFNNMESFGYTMLLIPIEALIMSYPMEGLNDVIMQEEKYSDVVSDDIGEEPVVDETIENEVTEITEVSNDDASSGEVSSPEVSGALDSLLKESVTATSVNIPVQGEYITSAKTSTVNVPVPRDVEQGDIEQIQGESVDFKPIDFKSFNSVEEETSATATSINIPVPRDFEKTNVEQGNIEHGENVQEDLDQISSTETYSILNNDSSSNQKVSSEEEVTGMKSSSSVSDNQKSSSSSVSDNEDSSSSVIQEFSSSSVSDNQESSSSSVSDNQESSSSSVSDNQESSSSSVSDNEDSSSSSVSDNEDSSSSVIQEFSSSSSKDTFTTPTVSTPKGSIGTIIQSAGNGIDPAQLTGKGGLERMMSYNESKKSAFEYKQSIVETYGRIFSPNVIGKYSSKIKSVLDNIVKVVDGVKTVSEGIILVYSQYIDAGLIPMALALEEMGFSRFGSNVRPLFKDKPTSDIDVRTMGPPATRDDFIPARYSMITGDVKLSPNNDYEVKGVTGRDNIHGHKVKVVLISRAGAEGIDFKCIRQIHILDPWYNMNRIEQIFGRGVRNFSHKDLDFEQRNVQLFMHGTILGDENKEEAADLYLYRVAEYKALQIGKITRVLKESAVDCIINHDQTKFTQENMASAINKRQVLSDGTVIEQFKFGDVPYSATCDYMDRCDYTCKPDDKATGIVLTEDTYNENFILANSDKIVQRIRMLMREGFFYKKSVLLRLIQTPKTYPLVQIYFALTHLIDDKTEFITDKYGRMGRLINIGEYYLFQPNELKDPHVSIFDRSVPIDYKHEMINFVIKPDITKNDDVIPDPTHNEFKRGEEIFNELSIQFNIAREFTTKNKVEKADNDWYKHCGIATKKLTKEMPELKESINDFVVAHMIESLMYHDKLHLLNYIYSIPEFTNPSVGLYIKTYFQTNSIQTPSIQVIIMYDMGNLKIMKLDKTKWIDTTHEDRREIARLPELQKYVQFDKDIYTNDDIVGFIGYEKNKPNLVFKNKYIKRPRDLGAKCDEAGKANVIELLNKVIGSVKYTKQNTQKMVDASGKLVHDVTRSEELCVSLEFILRHYDRIKKNNRRWFLTPEMAIYHKLYTVYDKRV
jgi:superfamily II DNA or RNA helicase